MEFRAFLLLLCLSILSCESSKSNSKVWNSNHGDSSSSSDRDRELDSVEYDLTPFRDRVRSNSQFRSSSSFASRSPTGVGTSNSNHACPVQLSERCTCGFRYDDGNRYQLKPIQKYYFVICENSGYTTTSVLEHLPVEVEVLVFTGNYITSLPANIFGRGFRYPRLRVINMTGNQIREIDGKAFHHVDNVEVLILAHNELSNNSIHNHPRMFSNFYNLRELYLTNAFNDEIWSFEDLAELFLESNLTSLERLHLGQNELETITNASIFCSLPSIRQIYLPQNKLTDDAELNVTCLENLEVVDLRQNRIQTISSKSKLWNLLNARNKHNESIRVELLLNPFNCDCNLQFFISWLQKEILRDIDVIRDNEDLVCETGNPRNNTKLQLRAVEYTTCTPLQVSNTAGSVVAGVVWVLCCIIIIVGLTIGYMYRGSFCRNVKPLLLSNAQGVKYTSIEKNEEAEIANV